MHYYNEIEDYAATWIENLILDGLIPDGKVDRRSIVDVHPSDLEGFTQCHFFAGIAGWALAARLAGWPDDRELWTGSPPCQPFSVAGRQAGTADDRHLWPHLFRLARARRPAVLMGEQVAAAVGKNWLDGVFADLEGVGYACGAAVVPACAVDAPHRRDRLWFVADDLVADADIDGWISRSGNDSPARHGHPVAAAGGASDGGALADASGRRCGESGSREVQFSRGAEAVGGSETGTAWANAGWIIGHDGKARRVEPGIRLLANGISARVGRLRAYGNAIVPQVAAEVIGAFMDARP